MTYNRFALAALGIGYAWLMSYLDAGNGVEIFRPLVIIGSLHMLAGALIFVWLVANPGISPARRVVAIMADVGVVSASLHFGGELYLWLYPLLLWVTFGNGFRLGVRYLFIASGISSVCFALLLAFSPFWHRYPALSIGCLLGLIVLPAYVSVLIRKLNDSIEMAEQANKSKSMFLASVSHELRTPLNAVIGLSDLMNATRLNAEQSDMSRTIGDAGRSLLSLINSVLDLSRLDVDKMPFVEEKVNLYGLLRQIRDITSVVAAKKGVTVHLQIDPAVPQFVMASVRQIEEIITNLVSNAVKFTSEGYVLIRVHAEASEGNQVQLAFEVKDTGIGIAPEAQESIFERFTQANESIVDKFGGTGLGLAIARKMVEKRGGSITVDSELEKGSTFTVRMAFEALNGGETSYTASKPVLIASTNDQVISAVQMTVPQVAIFSTFGAMRDAIVQFRREGAVMPIVMVDLACPGDLSRLADLVKPKDGKYLSASTIAIIDNSQAQMDIELSRHFVSMIEKPLSGAMVSSALQIGLLGASHGAESRPGDIFKVKTAGRILVADDNKTNQKVISKILERAGHQVEIAQNGQEAVELLEEGGFDLAFMDVNMPVMNGLDAARLYNFACAGKKAIPIFALTADVTEETRANCEKAGMVEALTKPIEPSKLLPLIDEQIIKNGGAVGGTRGSEDESADAADFADDFEAKPRNMFLSDDPINEAALRDLADLGGQEFMQHVVEQFMTDAAGILECLSNAAETHDYQAFRNELHALRSGAANVGAQKIFKSCLQWRAIDPEVLVADGDKHLASLREQLDDASRFLQQIVGGQAVEIPCKEAGMRA